MDFDYDYLVIGSGFGGSVSALRLSEKGYRVGVVEMGKRWGAQDFPRTNMNLRKHAWAPRLGLHGILQISFLRHAYIAHGAGVGGGSLVYANTLLVPPPHVFRDALWPSDEDWEAKLAPHYETAKLMLGAVEAKDTCATDELLRKIVDEDMFEQDSFRKHTVSVFYGEAPGETVPDPFFGGEGPDRTGCVQCGECMTGCRRGAKNTLDRNYLYLAENRGAEIIPERRVTDLRPIDGGYEVHTEVSTKWLDKDRRVLRARGVVLSAGVLGTVKLLLECKERGSLPKLSGQLGNYVRTNAEAFGAVRSKREVDTMRGIAITSGVHMPDGTHIEAVRWGRGSDFIGWQTTVLTGGGAPWPRWLRWMGNVVRHPLRTLRTMIGFGWGTRSVLLMAMKPSESYLRLRLRRKLTGRGLDTELAEGAAIETFMSAVHEVTRRMAEKMDGTAGTGLLEAWFDTATTAHILGGATMGRTAEDGVCDAQGRVYGYENLYVCDGSFVPANLTVNPSLTITALSEHAMSHVPPKDGAEQKPVELTARLAL